MKIPNFDYEKAIVITNIEDFSCEVEPSDLITCDNEKCDCLIEIRYVKREPCRLGVKSFTDHFSCKEYYPSAFGFYLWNRTRNRNNSPLLRYLRELTK